MTKNIEVLVNGKFELRKGLKELDIKVLDDRMIDNGFEIENDIFKSFRASRTYVRGDLGVFVVKFTKHSMGPSSDDGMRARYKESQYDAIDKWIGVPGRRMIVLGVYNSGDKLLIESVNANVIYEIGRKDIYFLFRRASTFNKLYDAKTITETFDSADGQHKSWIVPEDDLKDFINDNFKGEVATISEVKTKTSFPETKFKDANKQYEKIINMIKEREMVEKNKNKNVGNLGEYLFYNLFQNDLFLEEMVHISKSNKVDWLASRKTKADHDFDVKDGEIVHSFEVKTTNASNDSFYISSNEEKFAYENEDTWKLVRIDLSKVKNIFDKDTPEEIMEEIKMIRDFSFIELFTNKKMREIFYVETSKNLMKRR